MTPPENFMTAPTSPDAPGWPGIEPRWTSSAKEGLGTAYHTSCRLWFTLSHGIVNEIYYPSVDQPILADRLFHASPGRHPDRRVPVVNLTPGAAQS